MQQIISTKKEDYDKDVKHLEIEPPINKKKRRQLLIAILFILVLFRILLPYFVLKYVNGKLANLTEYQGHVNRIDISLIRGAYIIRDLSIVKINDVKNNTKDTIPFFISPKIDLSVEWRALFKSAIVGEIYVEDPVLNLVKGKHKNENVKADTADFRKLIKDLMPLTINHFKITNGQIHYIDNTTTPKVNIGLQELEVTAENLSNVNKSNELLPSHIEANSRVYGGNFVLKIDFDALTRVPTFDMNAELVNLDLTSLNNFLQAYGNFNVEKGQFGLYTEFAAKEGEFGGYVKPIINEIDVIQGKGNIKQVIWEMIIGSGMILFTNKNTEQVATKIPIKGRFTDPDINLWKAVSYILRNAFVQALRPSIDNSINIDRLEDDGKKTLLEKLFQKNKKENNQHKQP